MSDSKLHMEIARLYDGIVDCLEENSEAELRLWLDNDSFGRVTKGTIAHRFEEMIEELLWSSGSIDYLKSLLNRRELVRVLRHLDALSESSTKSADCILMEISKNLSIPNFSIKGRNFYRNELKRFLEIFDESPSSVASESRQFFEQLLREVALVSANTVQIDAMLSVLIEDNDIRLPPQWPERTTLSKDDLSIYLRKTGAGYGDLGFLIFLLAKTSSYVRSANLPYITLLTKEEVGHFHFLSESLRPYAHFKPADDKFALKEALQKMDGVIASMAERKVIPNAAILLETTESLFGRRYRGRDEGGQKVTIRTDDDIPLGKRILFSEVSNPIHRVSGWADVDW